MNKQDEDRDAEEISGFYGGAVYTEALSLVLNDVVLGGNSATVGPGIYWAPYSSTQVSLENFLDLQDAAVLRPV